ncbi:MULTISPECIES: hypothetical protein [unclassified Streptomyces]|uniref:hypothetical protein n=1 Tax=unclassified Streptomyces TaxID=2593676 RepID=UPI003D8F46D8
MPPEQRGRNNRHPQALGVAAFHCLLEAVEVAVAHPAGALGAMQVGEAQDEGGEQVPEYLDVHFQGQAAEFAVFALQKLQDIAQEVTCGAVGNQQGLRGVLVGAGGFGGGGVEEAGLEENDGTLGSSEVGSVLVDLSGACSPGSSEDAPAFRPGRNRTPAEQDRK